MEIYEGQSKEFAQTKVKEIKRQIFSEVDLKKKTSAPNICSKVFESSQKWCNTNVSPTYEIDD